MRLEEFGMRVDPFPIVPDGPVHNWAGRAELRDDLIDLIKGVRASDIGVTEFGVLYGEYGAGKSHALRYLKTLIDERKEEFQSTAIYLERPRVANKLNFLELYRYVIRQVGRDRVKEVCRCVRELTDRTGDEIAEGAGVDVGDKSSFVEAAINRLPGRDRNMVRLLRRGAEEASRVFEFLTGEEKCDGDEYEGRVDSDFIAAKVLADYFRVTTSEIRSNERINEAVYLFVDEMEVLTEAKATESDLVFNGLRELINGLPYRFGLLVSFSAATALIEAVMPQHLLKRMTIPYIEVPMLDDVDAKEFLRAQLDFFRSADSSHGGTLYPFDEEAIDFVIGNRTNLTPRSLFVDCKRVLERSIRRYDLEPGDLIEREMAERILVGYR